MIEIDGLSVCIRRRMLLDDISLTLEEGKIYALLGENGSGKTTLIRTLSSYYPEYSGAICFNGRELRSFSRREREHLHAVLPQSLPPIDLGVDSLLSMYPDGVRKLEELGFMHLLDKRMDMLSGGEREMVFLAFTLSHPALFYAFDEPEAGLDTHCKEKAEKAMKELASAGNIVLASFHDIGRAMQLSDGFIVLSQGHLAFAGGRDMLLDSTVIERIFGMERVVIRNGKGEESLSFMSTTFRTSHKAWT